MKSSLSIAILVSLLAYCYGGTPSYQQDFEEMKATPALPLISGISGQGVRLAEQSLRIPAKETLSADEGTISLWFKPMNWDLESEEFKTLLAGEFGQGKKGRFMIYKYRRPSKMCLTFLFGTGAVKFGQDYVYACSGETKLERGIWHHLAVTWSRGQSLVTMYLDGKRLCSDSLKDSMFFEGFESIVVNAPSFSPKDSKHETCYDSIRFYKEALTENDIAMLFQKERGVKPIPRALCQNTVVPLPKIAISPKIDGNFVDSEWSACSRLSGFTFLSDPTIQMALPADVYLGSDGTNLYFCTVATIEDATTLLNVQRERDSQVYQDDAMELHLLPPGQHKNYHLIYNAHPAIFDRWGADPKWNGRWTIKSGIYEGLWITEGMIPLSDFDTPFQDGAQWGFNVCRDIQKAPDIIFSSISPSQGFFNATGALCPSAAGTAARLFVNFQLLRKRQLELNLTIANPGETAKDIHFKGEILSADNETLRKCENTLSIAPHSSGKFPFSEKLGGIGSALIRVTATEASGAVLFRQDFPLKFDDSLTVVYDTNLARGELTVDVDAGSLPQANSAVAIHGTLLSPGGESCQRTTFIKHGSVNRGLFSLKGLPAGDYQVQFEFIDSSGKISHQCRKEYHHIASPEWLVRKSGAGIGVVYPYTPLTFEKGCLSCLGRTHRFGKSLLPEQITSQRQPLFAEKPRMTVTTADGQTQDIEFNFKSTKNTAEEVDFSLSARTSTLAFTGTLHCEFDGFLWYELDMAPLKENAEIQSLRLQMTFPAAIAQFLNAHFFARENRVGRIQQPIALKRFPSVWLGNLDVGLTFFTESFQYWLNADTEKTYAITPMPNGTVRMDIALIDTACTITAKQPRHYGFGIEANPVKPTPGNFRSWRVHSHSPYNITHPWQVDRKTKKYPGDLGFYTPVFTSDEAFMSQLTHFKDKANAAFSVYLNPFLVSGEATEYQVFRKEWNNPHNVYPQCPNSSFTDYITACIEHLVSLGLRSVYVDSLGAVNCFNPLHGCGYVDEKGKNCMTYPIRGMRNYMKRLYSMLHAPGRNQTQNFLWGHMSARTSAPLNAFVDFQCSGEELEYLMMEESNYLKLYPMDAFQIYYMPSSGVVPMLLPNLGRVGPKSARNEKKYNDQLLALVLLHDTMLWPCWCDVSYINRFYEKLDAWGYKSTELQFMNYRRQNVVTTTDKDTPISLYHLPKQHKTLAVIVNTLPKERTIPITLANTSLWQDKPVKITDFLNGGLPVHSNAIKLAPYGMAILEITSN